MSVKVHVDHIPVGADAPPPPGAASVSVDPLSSTDQSAPVDRQDSPERNETAKRPRDVKEEASHVSPKLVCRSGPSEKAGDPEIDNIRIRQVKAVNYPQLLMEEIPVESDVKATVLACRRTAASIVHGQDSRLLVIVGPCSIHDYAAAMEYAERLRPEAQRHSEHLLVMMRVYFEKPRTTVGWKGFINDPDINESYDVNKGLKAARKLLVDISRLGVPCASEFLDVILPQYYADVVSWAAIGARTTESQLHRELASGLSMPVGFKNGTSGDIQIAADAVKSSNHSHTFISISKQGTAAIVHSMGNPDCHVVLRGGKTGPNYRAENIQETTQVLDKSEVHPYIMVDASHGNAEKVFKNQLKVVDDLCSQISNGSSAIMGVMIESHLNEGNQKIPKVGAGEEVKSKLRYGVSITDGCIGWDETVKVLERLALAVQKRRAFKESSSTQ